MEKIIKSVLLFPGLSERNRDIIKETVLFVTDELKRAGIKIFAEEERIKLFSVCGAEKIKPDDEPDAIVAIGGDGTILRAARKAVGKNIPILGINAGRVGFLAQIERNEIKNLGKLACGEYKIDKRMLLEAKIIRNGKKEETPFFSINETTLMKDDPAHTVDVEVRKNGAFAYRCRADGIIAATPTGSTAYSMSAGGPISDPGAEMIIITPVCPHSPAARAVVFSDKDVITLKAAEGKISVVSDGEIESVISENDCVEIKKYSEKARFVNLSDKNFYETFNNKFFGI